MNKNYITNNNNILILKEGGIVPKGCIYRTSNGKTFEEGTVLASELTNNDQFESRDYIYTYEKMYPVVNGGNEILSLPISQFYVEGWYVSVKSKTKTAYEPIYYSINGKHIISLVNTFKGCNVLKEAPEIPSEVKAMNGTFCGCKSLKKAPVIPDNVVTMEATFKDCELLKEAPMLPNALLSLMEIFFNCKSLEIAPLIPEKIKSMRTAFWCCRSLKEAPMIPNGVISLEGTFVGCESLKKAPVIPSTVTDMNSTFANCISLKEAPVIPESVEYISNVFGGCKSLKGKVEINSNYLYGGFDFLARCAQDQEHKIILCGTCPSISNEVALDGTRFIEIVAVK